MMISPSDAKWKTETRPVVVRTSALLAPSSTPRTPATMTITIAMTITPRPEHRHDRAPVPRDARGQVDHQRQLATFTSSGCSSLGVIGIAGTDEQADHQRQ